MTFSIVSFPQVFFFICFFNAGRCESISCLSKVLPLWCRRESTTCLQGRVLQLHSGEWYSTTCEGMVQYQNICVGCSTTLYLLPARESGGDRKVAASPLPQLHGMLHLVPGTVLLGTNKPYNRSSGPPCRLLYFCTPPPHWGPATQLFVIQSLMGTLSP